MRIAETRRKIEASFAKSFRQREYRETLGDGIFHPLGQAWSGFSVFFDTLVEAHVGLGAVARVEDLADVVGDFLAHGDFGDVGLSVLLEMKLATLPRRGVESGFERGFKAFVGVGGNQIGNADASLA